MVTQNPPPTSQKTDQQIADLSPVERDKYFQDQAAAGIHDGGFFGWIKRMGAAAKAKADSEKVGDQNVKNLQNHHVEYVAGLHPSDADYQGHEHVQLKSYVDTNLDPQQITDVSTAYHGLHEAFDGFGKSMKQAVKQTHDKWHGDAAAAAQGYFSSLGDWADANSVNAKLASETIYDQQTAAANAKHNMPEVVPFNMADEIGKWAAAPDSASFAQAITNTYQTYNESQQAHDGAVHVMTQYDKDLYAAASKQPAFAEPPKFQAHGEITPKPIDGGGKRKSGETSGTATSSSGFTGGNVGVPPGSGVPSAPHGAAEPPPRSPLSPAGPSTGSGVLPGNTTPAGYQPTNPTPVAGNVPGASGGFGGMGAMPMGGMGGGVGGDAEYSNKLGRGGFGPGGSGGGSGSGSTPGAGNSSGAARPGGIGAAEAAAGRGMGPGGGAAGGRGGGMGGMGAGRGQGGEEDHEHQRPTYLVEGDPDEIFGSDVRTAPPVIGE